MGIVGEILVGTCSWTGEGLRGRFYPEALAPRDMLPYYAQHFRLVEMDSTFYHMPSERNSRLWAQRTPPGFIFDVKAYRRLTRHDREQEATEEDFGRFGSALRPLADAGRLGVVLFQFPPWFRRAAENFAYLRQCRDRLPDYPLAVEFRHGSWLWPSVAEGTLRFLRDHGLAFVSVDEPQFPGGRTVPPLAAATADIAVVRFHGRNREAWFQKDITAEERFNYLYRPEELAEWVPKIVSLAQQARQVHALMNNCYHDFAFRNARDLAGLLAAARP